MNAQQIRTVLLVMAFAILISIPETRAQNLVPNPSFEYYIICPSWVTQLELADPWESPTNTTPDYLHECATHPWVDVPLNAFGYQNAHTGVAYAGAQYRGLPFGNREYLMTPLTELLEAGYEYEISYWVSLADEFCGANQFGVYFSEEKPGPPENFGVLNVDPQFYMDTVFITDTANWVLISGCFIANGGEVWMTIGNFTPEYESPVDSNCIVSGHSYYYVDDVSLYKIGPAGTFELNLEDPVLTCGPYTIDPGIPHAQYIWEDGSQDSVLTVTEPGIYSVTVSTSCLLGMDSVEVIFHGMEEVDLGPEAISICDGESFAISLDPLFNSYTWQDGSTGPDYTITEPGLYQVTLDDGCQETMDAIEVTVVTPPPAFAIDADTILCPDEEIELVFDTSLGDFLWQDGDMNAAYIIYAPGAYAVTISNLCGIETASVNVISLADPVISIGPDSLYLCSGEVYPIQIDLDPNTHDFDWSNNSSEPDYVISAPGVHGVTVTNECGTATDSIIAFYQVAPVVDLGADTILCDVPTFTLDAGVYPGATYLWQDSSTTPMLETLQDGSYHVMVTTLCGVSTDTINLDFIDTLAHFTLGPDITICPGELLTLTALVPGASFLWQDSTTSDSLVVMAAGQYYVTAFTPCESIADTVVVSVNNAPPVVDLPAAITLCQGQSVVINAGLSGVNYLWSDNSTGSFLNVSNAGVYSITVSNNCGADADSVIVIDGGPAPAVDLGDDFSLCPGDTVDLVPAFSNVDTWQWSNGDVAQQIEITTGGIISVIVSNACGTSYDTINADLLPAVPTFTLGNDTALCENEILTLSINVPNVDIAWSDGTTNPDLEVSVAGQYFATVSNACGNFADTINISQLPEIPTLDLGNDQSLCPGELIIIDPGISDVDYLWHDGSSGSTFSTTQATTVSLTISNECGSSTDQLQIIESTEGPQVDLGADIIGCEGDTVTIPSGIAGVDYLWHDGSTLSSFITNSSGEIILIVTNNCGTDSDTVIVDLTGMAPDVDLGTDTSLCEGEILLLEINAMPGTVIEWQDGSSLPSFEVTSAGNYLVTNTNNCGQASDTIAIAYTTAPHPFDLGNDTILCPGESITLVAPVTTDVLQWQDGSNSQAYVADQAQQYSLQISNNCGSVSDAITLSYDTDQPVVALDPLTAWCPGDIITADVQQPFFANYTWSTGDLTSSIEIVTPGLYSVTVQSYCATASGQLEVMEDDDCFPKTNFYIPNTFSPNGDGINDVFSIVFNNTAEILSVEGTIYDRWGNLVFASTGNPFIWNGKRNEEQLNPGVYVYVIKITYQKNGAPREEMLTGDVTIVR